MPRLHAFPNPLAPSRLQGVTSAQDAAELAPGVWSMTAQRDADGAVEIGGIAAPELLARFGSPLYVIDEADVRTRAAHALADFRTAFAEIGAEVDLHYASKALLTTDIARWMHEAGLGLDVASAGEFEVAMAAGFPAAEIGMHGNAKTAAQLRRAIGAGIGTIIVDSLGEIDLIAAIAAELGRIQPVLVRINVGIHAATHDFLATSHEDQKFGLTLEVAREAIARIRATDSLEFRGLHSHIGSSIYDAAGFGAAAARLMRFRAELLEAGPVAEVNLGGGFGIAYLPTDAATPLADLARGIAAEVARACEETGTADALPRFTFEPGRSLVGTAGATLYTVLATKRIEVPATDTAAASDRNYVSVDGGMSDNARPALYGADYTARLANRSSTAAPALSRVVGSHCESGDIVVNDEYLPGDVAVGDVIAVPATGAYCFSLASHYNYADRPALVAVRDGEARLLVRRITIDDLLAADTGATGEER